MNLEVEDLLFSEGGFKMPSVIEEEGPSYNPSVELIYDPQSYSEGEDHIAFNHELFHHQMGELPSLCFERALSFLLTQEFAKDRFKDSSALSALLPSKNPTVQMLNTIFQDVHRHNSAAQEAFAIQADYHNRKEDLKEAEKNPDKWLRNKVEKYSKKFEDFDSFNGIKTVYGLFWRSDFMWKARGIMRGFAFAPPFPSIDFPSTADNKLDHSKIDLAYAKKIIGRFRERYLEFPYSPWKRLATLVKIAREVNKSRNPTLDHYLERIHNYGGFITAAFRVVKAAPHRLGLYLTSKDKSGLFGIDLVCPYEKPLPSYCPIDMFDEQGLDIDIEGFGDPIKLDGDHENEISRCRKIKCPRDIHIRKDSNICAHGIRSPFYKMLSRKPRAVYTIVDKGERLPVNWPRRSFLLASEALKDIVFNYPELAEQYSRVVLTEYFQIVRGRSLSGEVMRGRSHQGRLTQFVKQLQKEEPFFKVKEKLGLLGAQDISPFISIEVKEAQSLLEPARTMGIRLA